MEKPQTKWAMREIPDPMNDQEKEAYAHMQAVVFSSAGKSSHIPRKIVLQEAEETDLSTPQGRKARSKKNLEFLREQNADCPTSLVQELAGKVQKMRTTLFHKSFNYLPIVESGTLLSNRALKDAGIKFSGSTNTGSSSDETNFGNTGFVFTRPMFDNPADTFQGGSKVCVPINDAILSDYAWLSFEDWICYSSAGAEGARDNYAGNLMTNEKRQSFLYDFFQGKDDIAQATAFKVFEGICWNGSGLARQFHPECSSSNPR